MKKTLLYILTALLIISCDQEQFLEAEPMIVVEGWIDAGGYPKVFLSHNIPAADVDYRFDELDEYLVRWAKVTVSDGDTSVVLTGRYTEEYFPPYVYTTGEMRGEEGKTYYLTVEYKDFYAIAQTTIPPKVEVKKFQPLYDAGKYHIKALIDDNPIEQNYYKFFTRIIGRDSMYLSSNSAVIADKDYVFPAEIIVNMGSSIMYNNEDNILSEDDALLIKFAQIDSVAYDFWDEYKNMMGLGQNIFFRNTKSLPTNIIGGMGYWFGYGATEYLLEPYNHENPKRIR